MIKSPLALHPASCCWGPQSSGCRTAAWFMSDSLCPVSALTPIFYGLKPLVKCWGRDSFLISSYLGRSAGVRREITIANITSCPDPILATVLNLDCLCQNKTNKSSLPINGPNYYHLTNTLPFPKVYWTNVVSWFTKILVGEGVNEGASVIIRVKSVTT